MSSRRPEDLLLLDRLASADAAGFAAEKDAIGIVWARAVQLQTAPQRDEGQRAQMATALRTALLRGWRVVSAEWQSGGAARALLRGRPGPGAADAAAAQAWHDAAKVFVALAAALMRLVRGALTTDPQASWVRQLRQEPTLLAALTGLAEAAAALIETQLIAGWDATPGWPEQGLAKRGAVVAAARGGLVALARSLLIVWNLLAGRVAPADRFASPANWADASSTGEVQRFVRPINAVARLALALLRLGNAAGVVGLGSGAHEEACRNAWAAAVEACWDLPGVIAKNSQRFEVVERYGPAAMLRSIPLALDHRAVLPAVALAEVLSLAVPAAAALAGSGSSGSSSSSQRPQARLVSQSAQQLLASLGLQAAWLRGCLAALEQVGGSQGLGSRVFSHHWEEQAQAVDALVQPRHKAIARSVIHPGSGSVSGGSGSGGAGDGAPGSGGDAIAALAAASAAAAAAASNEGRCPAAPLAPAELRLLVSMLHAVGEAVPQQLDRASAMERGRFLCEGAMFIKTLLVSLGRESKEEASRSTGSTSSPQPAPPPAAAASQPAQLAFLEAVSALLAELLPVLWQQVLKGLPSEAGPIIAELMEALVQGWQFVLDDNTSFWPLLARALSAEQAGLARMLEAAMDMGVRSGGKWAACAVHLAAGAGSIWWAAPATPDDPATWGGQDEVAAVLAANAARAKEALALEVTAVKVACKVWDAELSGSELAVGGCVWTGMRLGGPALLAATASQLGCSPRPAGPAAASPAGAEAGSSASAGSSSSSSALPGVLSNPLVPWVVLVARALEAAGRMAPRWRDADGTPGGEWFRAAESCRRGVAWLGLALRQLLDQQQPAATAAAASGSREAASAKHAAALEQLLAQQASLAAALPRAIPATCPLSDEVAGELQAFGAALVGLLPLSWCCNNPGCKQLASQGELALVSGKGHVCGGCRVARFCSRACQAAAWPRHKRACKLLAAAAAATE